MKPSENEENQFVKLCNNLGDVLNGESMSIVIPALVSLLAHAGVDSDVEYKRLVFFVVNTITDVYKENNKGLFDESQSQSQETFH